jgi:hypothetical protein
VILGVGICLYVPADRLAFWATFVMVQGNAHRLSEISYDVELYGDTLFSQKMFFKEYCIVLDLCVRCFRTKAKGERHHRLGRRKIRGFILLLAVYGHYRVAGRSLGSVPPFVEVCPTARMGATWY